MVVTFDKEYLRELYETGKGDKAGISSIRINDQYRIEFTVSGQYPKLLFTSATY